MISVNLPLQGWKSAGANVFNVVNRCFQIVQSRTVRDCCSASNIIITPDVASFGWNGFSKADELICAGERAASDAMATIETWVSAPHSSPEVFGRGYYPAVAKS